MSSLRSDLGGNCAISGDIKVFAQNWQAVVVILLVKGKISMLELKTFSTAICWLKTMCEWFCYRQTKFAHLMLVGEHEKLSN